MANQSTFAAPQKADNWRAVVGNKLPDGSADVTEGIYHDGAVHLGNANVNGNTRFKHLGIASYTGNGLFTSQVIQTNIPKDSTIMPSIDLKGYAYDLGNTVDVQIGLYTYTIPSGSIINTVWQSKGTSSPLAIRAGWNSANLLALEITWAAADDYFNRYCIDAYSDGNSGAQQDSWFENWTITNTLFDASFTQVVNLANKDKVVTLPFATPAQTIAGTATNLIVNPADLYARENIAAQTGLGLVLSAIPAPTASQSNWGTNTLGETLHYMPGVGWKIVSDFYQIETAHPNIPVGAGNTVNTIAGSHTALRAGKITVSFFGFMGSTTPNVNTYFSVGIGKAGQATIAGNSSFMRDSSSQSIGHSATATFTVAAGDVITYRISAVNGVDVAYMKSTVLYSA